MFSKITWHSILLQRADFAQPCTLPRRTVIVLFYCHNVTMMYLMQPHENHLSLRWQHWKHLFPSHYGSILLKHSLLTRKPYIRSDTYGSTQPTSCFVPIHITQIDIIIYKATNYIKSFDLIPELNSCYL